MSKMHLAIAAAAFFTAAASATTVLPNGSLIDLGSFAAGSYRLTGSGLIDLCGNGTFTMRPDGTPNSVVTCSNYGAGFNPVGSFAADNSYARAGLNAKIGALIGTLNENAYAGLNPTTTQASDWFLIGSSKIISLSSTGHIFASVNDTFYQNNTGSFQVNVSYVSEPTGLALLLSGLATLGAVLKRRKA